MTANRHHEIADALRRSIARGRRKEGEQLPAETDLARQHSASVPTVRLALEILRDEGLIEKQHGRGSFVRKPFARITYSNDRRTADAHAVLTVSVQSKTVRAHGRLPELLGVASGTTLAEYVYLSRQGDSPHSLARIYVPTAVASLRVDAIGSSPIGDDIRHQLAALGVLVSTTVERLTARSPSPEEARALRVGANTALLAIDRVSSDETGRVVEAALLVLPGHRAQAVFTTPASSDRLEATG